MCLGLEMHRGGDIKVVDSRLKVVRTGTGAATPEAPLKEGVVEVETPTDVRVYIDERCVETVGWFERTFCRKGSEGRGVRLEVGGEQVIIFATHPAIPKHPNESTSTTRPELVLHLGRAALARIRKPRPDDPLPRENLFASKLRRTNSLPVLSFDAPSSRPKALSKSKSSLASSSFASSSSLAVSKPRPRGVKAKAKELQVQGLLAGKDSVPSLLAPPDVKGKGKARAPLSRSTSSATLLMSNNKRPRPSSTEFDLFSATSDSTQRRSQGSALSRRLHLTEDSSSDEEDGFSGGMPGSPTPSVATTFGGGAEEEGEAEERADVVGELGGFRGGKRKKMERSISAPVGVLSGRAKMGGTEVRRERAQSREGSVDGENGVEAKNKATLKKIVLSRLVDRDIPRTHDQFRDLFSMTLKGVQFALRTALSITALDRLNATRLVDLHLDMYIDSTTAIKIEEENGLLPSPESMEAS
ncbi:hypothetical protein P7C70_g143, partial [Phenoliferia sp. Uapishka_3]